MKKLLVLLATSLLTLPVAHAAKQKEKGPNPLDENPALVELFNQRLRPTIAEFQKAAAEGMNKDWETLLKKYRDPRANLYDLKKMAKLIASFERISPGSTYAQMGRDVALVGDILDAFYSSIGQPNRVVRIDMSAPSFMRLDRLSQAEKNKYLFNYLTQTGFNFKSEFGYTLFDVTSWRSTAQSRTLLRSIFTTYKNEGGEPADLYPKVNFIGFNMGQEGEDFNEDTDVEFFTEQMKATVDESGPALALIMGYKFNDYNWPAAWHGIFNGFEINDSGVMIPTFDKPYGDNTSEKLRIMSELYDLNKIMQNPELLKEVQKAAAKLDYEFPLTRTSKINVKEKPKPRDVFEGVKRTRFPPPIVERARRSSSFNVGDYIKVMKDKVSSSDDPEEHTAYIFEDVEGMYARGSLSWTERERVLKEVFKHMDDLIAKKKKDKKAGSAKPDGEDCKKIIGSSKDKDQGHLF